MTGTPPGTLPWRTAFARNSGTRSTLSPTIPSHGPVMEGVPAGTFSHDFPSASCTCYAGARSKSSPLPTVDAGRVTGGREPDQPSKKATTTVPIVFAGLIDPVASGIVPSLARPGGNITGVTVGIGGAGFATKWVELLKEATPDVSHIAVLSNSASAISAAQVREIQAAARTLKVKLDVLDVFEYHEPR